MNGERLDRNCHLIGPDWVAGQGHEIASLDPATGRKVWSGRAATEGQVDDAVAAAKEAFAGWRDLGFGKRLETAEHFAHLLEENRNELARLISLEVGKPLWESHSEVTSMVAKAAISAEAFRQRCAEESRAAGEATSRTTFRPHGVVAVFGPFNFPGHIANGHIVPALLAGNVVVFKPSEQAPAVARMMIELWRESRLPPGVLNLLQGAAPVGEALASHPDLDGLFFTGSHRTGMALHRLFADNPGKILALEMGGNNPLLVFDPGNLEATALLIIQSAYLTAGQRCTCARRLVISDTSEGDAILDALIAMMERIRVGVWTDTPEPFMGPVISLDSLDRVLAAQAKLVKKGGVFLVEAERLRPGTCLVSPGLVDVTAIGDREDEEIFGPLLQVVRVPDFSAGLAEANRTRFGLAAGLVTRDRKLWEEFRREVRAGVINWNQQLTGASSRAPFGGVGQSGNHRPSGFFAADYCSCPTAIMEREEIPPPRQFPPGFEAQG